jgi:tripartite-type tricarboxylate transporter receptor subunit TctC
MEDNVKRICAALLALAGIGLGIAAPASAQTWPTKPVRIVNTFAPGGAAEFLARTVADGLTKSFGQQFYVETRAGAAGQIGVHSVITTPPDGYNFVLTNVSMLVLAPISNPKLGYDPLRDITNIAYIAGSPIVVSVNSKGGIRTLDEFIGFAKRSDKPLTYSSSGVGSSGQLFSEQLAQRLNVRFEHVPYKGAMQGLMDLVGGHIMFSAQTVTSSAALIRGGALNAVALTAKERMPDFPDVPTFKELGYPDLVSTTWFALSGPPGLPNDIVQKVNGDIAKTMARPDIQQRMRQEGMLTEALTPEGLRQLIVHETGVWRPVIEKAGLIEK